MSQRKNTESPLVAAAIALDDELERFNSLAHDAKKIPLSSEKNLRKAGEALAAVVESENRLSQLVGALNQALIGAREAQQVEAHAVNAHAQVIAARANEFQALVDKLRSLGGRGGEITTNPMTMQPPKRRVSAAAT